MLFESEATDLVPGDTNGLRDIFMRNVLNGTTSLVSVGTNGSSANGSSRDAVMTPDGRYVAFVSAASNLVENDTNGIPDIFVRDLQTGTTVIASTGATRLGTSARSSEAPEITPDGRFVAFYSTATNLVPGATNGEVYVRDLITGTTIWASTNAQPLMNAAQIPGGIL